MALNDYYPEFCMVREPIECKFNYKKNEYSCDKNMVIMDNETGELFCQNCGIVQGMAELDVLSFPYGNRTSIRLYDMGLPSTVSNLNRDAAGKTFDSKTIHSMNRLRYWDSRCKIKNSSEKNLRLALLEIEKLKEKLSLSDNLVERTAYLYRKSASSGLIQGRSIKSMVGACVYVACREMDVSRTIHDISSNLQAPQNSITKNYRLLIQNLSLKIPTPDPLKRIIKIANNLELSENSKRESIKIFNRLKKYDLISGKNPETVASTVIYMASILTCENLSQKKISDISGISTVAIRNRYKEYQKWINLI